MKTSHAIAPWPILNQWARQKRRGAYARRGKTLGTPVLVSRYTMRQSIEHTQKTIITPAWILVIIWKSTTKSTYHISIFDYGDVCFAFVSLSASSRVCFAFFVKSSSSWESVIRFRQGDDEGKISSVYSHNPYASWSSNLQQHYP